MNYKSCILKVHLVDRTGISQGWEGGESLHPDRELHQEIQRRKINPERCSFPGDLAQVRCYVQQTPGGV